MRILAVLCLAALLVCGQEAADQRLAFITRFDPPCEWLGICPPEWRASALVQVNVGRLGAARYEITLVTETAEGELAAFSGTLHPDGTTGSMPGYEWLWLDTGRFIRCAAYVTPVYEDGSAGVTFAVTGP